MAGLLSLCGTALAQQDSEVVVLDVVLVSGVRPAPGLWTAVKGDKTVLIMGTLTPVPRGLTWHSDAVREQIARADVILGQPGISVGTNVGIIQGALALPAYRKFRRNPDGKQLQDVLTPDQYTQWIRLKQIYIGRDRSVERLRPVNAAAELSASAIKRIGLENKDLVQPVVREIAERRGIPIISTKTRIVVENPRETLAELNAKSLDDSECLVRTMERLDADLQNMASRANAWADGDLETLRALSHVNERAACAQVLASTELAVRAGVRNVETAMRQKWLDTLDGTLEQHDTVFATLPIARLLEQEGILSELEGRGFTVYEPGQTQ
ncbi:TraB/GumN family protein [Luteimonas sp. RC10]|uniref:TraB/GumN family protein n=1 Tax=Luteimonas sp. RC10 TaxID=2587035 RepID=UPI00160BAFB4|nr:TraB/GumN family protein [Luteimonas sp. RC10]MBB3342693.1 hypothetical protein [Luteimonas sp. RC10]